MINVNITPGKYWGCFICSIIFCANLHAATPDSLLNILYTSGIDVQQAIDQSKVDSLCKEIDEKRSQNNPFIAVKIGDVGYFNKSQNATLPNQLKFDVAMPGFDALVGGLDHFSHLAQSRADSTPLVLTNLLIDSLKETSQTVHKLIEDKLLREYIILKSCGYRIGVFAVLGNEVIFKLQNRPGLSFKDPELAAQQASRFLQFHEKVDFVVGLTFSGLRVKPGGKKWTGEAQYLGIKAPDIDVLISSGTNCAQTDSTVSKNTPILQASDTKNEINFAAISIAGTNRRLVDRSHWKIAAPVDVNSLFVQNEFPVSGLGNLVTDAILQAMIKRQEKVDFAFMLNENIRRDLQVGRNEAQNQKFVNNVFPEFNIPGLHADGLPLVRFYLNGEDLQKVLEITSSIYPLKGKNYFLHLAGLKVRYNTSRIIFNRVVQASFSSANGPGADIEFSRKKRYAVVCDWITAQRLQSIHKMASGFLRITLRDSSGAAVKNLSATVLKPHLSAQRAVQQFCSDFGSKTAEGLPEIPKRYLQPESRLIVSTSLGLSDLLSNPNMVMVSLIVISLLMVAGVAAIFVVLIRRIRHS